MNMSDIVSILDTSAGDMLKAQVLAAVFPEQFGMLDLTRLKLPPGAVERAFQEAANAKTKATTLIPRQPREPLAERMSSVPKMSDPWPSHARFDNEESKPQPVAEPELPKEPEEYVEADEAIRLGIKSPAMLSYYAKHGKIQRKKHPEDGRRGLYLKGDVLACVGS